MNHRLYRIFRYGKERFSLSKRSKPLSVDQATITQISELEGETLRARNGQI